MIQLQAVLMSKEEENLVKTGLVSIGSRIGTMMFNFFKVMFIKSLLLYAKHWAKQTIYIFFI